MGFSDKRPDKRCWRWAKVFCIWRLHEEVVDDRAEKAEADFVVDYFADERAVNAIARFDEFRAGSASS
jgi:hypothetical protein